jgi:protein TonB
MQANHILTADLLDIIFDERNKEYGAYDLRKNYQQRLGRSVLAMLLIVILLLIAYFLFGSMKSDNTKLLAGPDIKLDAITPKDKKVEIIVPPTVKHETPKIKTIQLTVPKIEENPPENERPPEVKDVENAKIATYNSEGKDDDGSITPPVDERKGVVEAPKKQDNDDVPFTRVEIESQYPGGLNAWAAYLNRNLSYPQDAVDKEVQGMVIIQFIVDIMGNVSDVNAISGPEELRAAAINVIKKSG